MALNSSSAGNVRDSFDERCFLFDEWNKRGKRTKSEKVQSVHQTLTIGPADGDDR